MERNIEIFEHRLKQLEETVRTIEGLRSILETELTEIGNDPGFKAIWYATDGIREDELEQYGLNDELYGRAIRLLDGLHVVAGEAQGDIGPSGFTLWSTY